MNDAELFAEIEARFQQKMRDAVSEITAAEIQDWSRISVMAEQYGGFLNLFPESLADIKPYPEKIPRKTKKAAAKKAPAKKAPAKKP